MAIYTEKDTKHWSWIVNDQKLRFLMIVSHVPRNLVQTNISVHLSDNISKTVDNNLPNDQIKKWCLSTRVLFKSLSTSDLHSLLHR